MTNTLTFHDTPLTIHDAEGQRWLTAQDISIALGYNRSSAVTEIYQRNRTEFNGDTSLSLKLRDEQGILRKRRVFNRRGAHLIAMFAKTERAKEFRKWVLDVLEEKTSQSSMPIQQELEVDLIALEEKLTRQYSEIRALPRLHNRAGNIKDSVALPSKPSSEMVQEIRLAYLRSLDLVEALAEVERVRTALHTHLDVCSRLVFPNGMPQPRKMVVHV